MARVKVQVPLQQNEAATLPPPPAHQPNGLPRLGAKNKLMTIVVLGIGVAVIFLIIALINDRKQLKQEVIKLSNSQAANPQNDAQKYQEEIGKIAELPTGQTPSLIPVTDAAKLAAENTFFKNAQNGDVVLLYVSPDKSVRAILYRPSTHKIIEATSSATLGTGSNTTQP